MFTTKINILGAAGACIAVALSGNAFAQTNPDRNNCAPIRITQVGSGHGTYANAAKRVFIRGVQDNGDEKEYILDDSIATEPDIANQFTVSRILQVALTAYVTGTKVNPGLTGGSSCPSGDGATSYTLRYLVLKEDL